MFVVSGCLALVPFALFARQRGLCCFQGQRDRRLRLVKALPYWHVSVPPPEAVYDASLTDPYGILGFMNPTGCGSSKRCRRASLSRQMPLAFGNRQIRATAGFATPAGYRHPQTGTLVRQYGGLQVGLNVPSGTSV